MIRARRVFLDANVFVTSWTLDILLTLADQSVIEPIWSEKVLDEACKAINRVHRTRNGRRYLAEAARAYPYAIAEANEKDLANIELPDPNDRHVVAGAIAGRCEIIVTYNIRDFPKEILAPSGLRAMHPDDFLIETATSNPDGAMAAIRALVSTKKHPPRSFEEEIEGLRANMLGRFADFVQERVSAGETLSPDTEFRTAAPDEGQPQ
ncbi:PIN domain-containing protein [Adlercreutzia sp. ZJ473]|uniref:PIN domain-containing protein n=1 Tax=Adlercreutzia sp. ZJ473 TaxID=2722822 RepID=UPI001552A882|nr:PIN domain-containing protein [Adlercreutzia sp. ZJ473]